MARAAINGHRCCPAGAASMTFWRRGTCCDQQPSAVIYDTGLIALAS